MTFLAGYKTYLICAIALLYDGSQLWSGAIDVQTAIQIGLAALGAAGLRAGISSAK